MSGTVDNEALRSRFTRAREESKKSRSLWGHFVDSLTEGAVHSGLGAEPAARARLKAQGRTAEEINQGERRLIQRLEQRRNVREQQFRDVDTLSPANIGKWAVDLAGNIIGGVDPTYVLAPGKNALQRIASQAGINLGADVFSQGQEVRRGVKDEFDPREAALAAAGGAVLQGAGETISRTQLGRRVNRGSAMPSWQEVNNIIVRDLEGGGTLAKPKVSPKGAMGPQQVMPETARKPGFGIRPWDGKTQADLARVGRQYSAAMMDKYNGDVAKVFAAYNAGPGRVDGLVKKYGDDWRSHLPEETRKYVTKGLRKLGQEQGPEDLGDVRLVQDELPALAEMARVNEQLAPNDLEILDAVMRQADDNNVVPFPVRQAIEESQQPLISSDDFVDVLTPAERQEMDASVPRPPEVRGALSEDILGSTVGRGGAATTPVNDLREVITEPPARPPFPGEEGFEASPGPKGGDDTPTGTSGLENFTAALKTAKKAGPEQRKLYRQERGKRTSEMIRRGQYTQGEEGFRAEKGALKGELPKIDIEPIRDKLSQTEIDGLLEGIKTSRRLRPLESVTARDAVIGLLDGKLPTKSELELLYRVHPEIVQEVLNKRTISEKAKDYLLRAYETSRGQMGSGDVSFGGRQGIMMVSRPEWWKAEAGQFKALSPSQGDEVLNLQTERIVQHPHYDRSKTAGIKHMDVGGHGSREEFAAHTLAESIPVIGQIPKASNRAYTYMGNELRYGVFYSIVDKAQRLGVDVDDPVWLKALGDYINTFTGRAAFGKGKVGKALESSMPLANILFFAPRFVLSTFQRLNPLLWRRAAAADISSGSPVILKEMLRDSSAYFGMMFGLLGLASQAGYEVDWDPRSPTGLKIKHGKTTYDVGGGMVQTVNFIAKMLTGEKITGKGEEQSLRDPEYGGDTNWDTLARFVRTKLHPTLSYLVNMKEGENVVGREFDKVRDSIELVSPMYASTVAEHLQENGIEGIFALPAAFFGWGLSNYDPEKIGQKRKEKQAEKKGAKEQVKDFEDFGDKDGFDIKEWDF